MEVESQEAFKELVDVLGRKPPHVSEEPMTYEEYRALPMDDYCYELVEQKLELMSPAPSTLHQLFVATLRDVINETCSSDYLLILSPIDVVFSDHDVRQPDLILVHRSRMDIVKVRGIFGVPDLVVEVVSPGSFQRDRKEKVVTYSKYRVPEYWLADPVNSTLEQYFPSGDKLILSEVYEGDELVRSERMPCINFTMSALLKTLPELSD